MHLRESTESNADIVVVESESSSIRDKEYHIFYFEPIRCSIGKTLYFYIETNSPDSTLALLGRLAQ